MVSKKKSAPKDVELWFTFCPHCQLFAAVEDPRSKEFLSEQFHPHQCGYCGRNQISSLLTVSGISAPRFVSRLKQLGHFFLTDGIGGAA